MGKTSCFEQLRTVMELEARAILEALDRVSPDQFDHAINLLSRCSGKIVLVGVGKSGNIAQKIAGTLTSTGSAAVFIHPSDAMHGGLGLVSKNDVVLAISNSGESEEILAILPNLERRGVPFISLV